jgi:hypothetical protein
LISSAPLRLSAQNTSRAKPPDVSPANPGRRTGPGAAFNGTMRVPTPEATGESLVKSTREPAPVSPAVGRSGRNKTDSAPSLVRDAPEFSPATVATAAEADTSGPSDGGRLPKRYLSSGKSAMWAAA